MKLGPCILFSVFALSFAVGCAQQNCEDLCDCAAAIYEQAGLDDFDEEQCVEDCRSDYGEDKACRKSVRELVKCIEDDGCDPTKCQSEQEELYGECNFAASPDEF